jgi:hypothetical protein
MPAASATFERKNTYLLVRLELDHRIAGRQAHSAIEQHLGAGDRAERAKDLAKVLGGHVARQLADADLEARVKEIERGIGACERESEGK